jgi:hypothetical protein
MLPEYAIFLDNYKYYVTIYDKKPIVNAYCKEYKNIVKLCNLCGFNLLINESGLNLDLITNGISQDIHNNWIICITSKDYGINLSNKFIQDNETQLKNTDITYVIDYLYHIDSNIVCANNRDYHFYNKIKSGCLLYRMFKNRDFKKVVNTQRYDIINNFYKHKYIYYRYKEYENGYLVFDHVMRGL